MARLQKKAKGRRPQYFENPAIDKVLSITMALAGEVAVMRDRLDTVERLSANGQPFGPEEVDRYQPDAKVREHRDAWRERFLDIVLRSVLQEVEELESQERQGSYEDAIRTVEDESGDVDG